MRELIGMLSGLKAIGDMSLNYDSRKVSRDKAGNTEVSTVYTTDEGYETALIDSDGEVYPVERYPDRERSVDGHAKWVNAVQSGTKTFTRLGGLDGCVGTKEITLKA